MIAVIAVVEVVVVVLVVVVVMVVPGAVAMEVVGRGHPKISATNSFISPGPSAFSSRTSNTW